MPYIKPEDKPQYESAIKELVWTLTQGEYLPGELTYVLYVIALRVAMTNLSYSHLSRVRASVQDTADELYRCYV